MTVEGALHKRLAEWVELIPIVADRIYHLRIPQSVDGAAIRLQRIASPRPHGFGGAADREIEAMFQVDCFGPKGDAGPIARTAADGVIAAMASWTQDGPPEVLGVFVDDDSADIDEASRAARVTLDVRIWFRG